MADLSSVDVPTGTPLTKLFRRRVGKTASSQTSTGKSLILARQTPAAQNQFGGGRYLLSPISVESACILSRYLRVY